LKSAVYAVLPVLEARFERSGFVTLDALELDLFCGGATFIKCGAPPSVIIRGDKAEKIAAKSLPAGLREEPAVIYSKIRAGDTVIMATDGVNLNCGMRGTPFDICGALTEKAADDDAAAVVLRLKEA
ncbi:MAG: SpoIIE family protein phosphatase, partial [Clostridia bacterium]|nr:SpoIIE family protein phosphatase [Clostridia bacterium]